MSLDQLSKLTGVSKSMLRQIENGKSSPTIATIWKIANGVRVSFTALLRKPAVAAEVRLLKAESPLVEEQGHYRVYPLVPFEPESAFETYYVEIDPDTTFIGEPHEGNVHEYLFIRSGKLQVSLGGEVLVADSNKFLQFHANCPHEYKNISDTLVSMIMQISYLA